MSDQIYRYTELPYVLQILSEKQLTLLSPNSWDDKNDAHFVECFRSQQGHASLLALCLTEATQTYHHWKIFTAGASGACIAFNKRALADWLVATPEIVGQPVVYETVNKLKLNPPRRDQLPFLKRKAYSNEKEFRLIHCANKKISFKNFKIPLEIIDSVILNPWMPKPTVGAMTRVINSIDGCKKIPVLRATIVENNEWRQLADNALV